MPQRNVSANAGEAGQQAQDNDGGSARFMRRTIGRSRLTDNEHSRRRSAATEPFAPRTALIRRMRNSLIMRLCSAMDRGCRGPRAGLCRGRRAGGRFRADARPRPSASQSDEIVIRATLDASARRGTVRAAMLIDAPPAVVFQMMTRCADAVRYVPHLRLCRVRDRAADDSWAAGRTRNRFRLVRAAAPLRLPRRLRRRPEHHLSPGQR